MTKNKDLHSFLPHSQVSIIADTTPLKDVLPYLSGSTSGFVLQNSDHVTLHRGYVSGEQVFNLVKSGRWKHLKEKQIFELVEDPHVEVSMIPMAEKVLPANDEGTSSSTLANIVRVVEPKNNETLGFLFPDKCMEIHIPPRLFWCANRENSHPNAQPGRCRSCPFPVPG